MEQESHRWIGADIVVLGPWCDLLGSYAGEVVGYTARDDSYTVSCSALFDHLDSLPLSPDAPSAPEVGDVSKMDKKSMIRAVTLARLRGRGERLKFGVPQAEVPADISAGIVQEMTRKVSSLSVPTTVAPSVVSSRGKSPTPEVETVPSEPPSIQTASADPYEEDKFEDEEVGEDVPDPGRRREITAYDDEDFEEVSEPSRGVARARVRAQSTNDRYDDDDFEDSEAQRVAKRRAGRPLLGASTCNFSTTNSDAVSNAIVNNFFHFTPQFRNHPKTRLLTKR